MIKIDVDTRVWEIPEEEKFLGVESDGNVKRYQFELSKNEFYKGLNFTDCNCFINYKNEDNDAIPYGITDMKLQSDGKVKFTWEVSRGATIFKGNTLAVLCVKKVRDDGTVTNEWNSRIGAFIVNKGIEPNQNIVEQPEIDIISQLLNTAQYVNQIAQENITKSEENIAKSEELIEQAQELLEQSDFYKGYIVKGETYSGKASNSGIKLHLVKGKTSQKTTNGYQLFDASKLASKSQGGATVTNNGDGSFTISGSGNLTESYSNAYIYSNEQFKNFIKKGQLKLNAGSSNPKVSITFYDDSVSPSKVYFDLEHDRSSGTITDEILNNSNIKMRIRFYGLQNSVIEIATIKPMLYQDGDGTFEEFTGGKPAPNPDYAMPIENVNIKNILSANSLMNESNIEIRGCFIQSNNIIADYDNTWNISKYIPIPSGVSKLNFKTKGISPSICFYGKNKEYISGESYNSRIVFSVDIPSNAYFMRLSISSEYVDKAYYCCLESQTWKNNEIETNLTLAQDDIYQNETNTRARKQATFDGSSDESWVLNPSWTGNSEKYAYFYTRINDIKSNLPVFVANRFECITDKKISVGYDGEAIYKDSSVNDVIYFSILKSRLSSNDVNGFKQWLQSNPVIVEYELATPTTEEFKVPTIPSYYPYTQISTDNDLTTDIQWKLLADSDRSLEVEANEKRIAALEKQLIGG